jgi:hypothetical protein
MKLGPPTRLHNLHVPITSRGYDVCRDPEATNGAYEFWVEDKLVRRFTHISRLDSGGRGDVYKVMDTTCDEANKPMYALKIVDKEANIIELIRESLDSMRELGKMCKSIADVKETYLFRTTAWFYNIPLGKLPTKQTSLSLRDSGAPITTISLD